MKRCRSGILWDEDDVEDILHKYVNLEKSSRTIAKNYNVDKGSILKLLKQKEVTRKRGYRKYRVNDKYFDTINTEEKAYWLGMIAADGNVYKNTLQLGLQKQDKEHLLKFRNAINSTHKLISLDKNQYSLQIYSKNLVQSLKQYYIVPNKHKIVKPPNINKKLMSHYWRGVFDGDGHIGCYKGKWHISICGNELMLNEYACYVKKICNTMAQVRKQTNSSAYIFKVGGNLITPQLANSLYKGSTELIRLNRKYSKYLTMKKELI